MTSSGRWEDKATVPPAYDSRGDKLGVSIGDLNERLADKLEELETEDLGHHPAAGELRRDYHVITAGKRLDQVARDFVAHYSKAWESGKAMLVMDKVTCVRDAQADRVLLGATDPRVGMRLMKAGTNRRKPRPAVELNGCEVLKR